MIAGAVIGSIFGSILLTVGSFLFYKRYKNNSEQNKAIPTPGNSNYSNRASQVPIERLTYYQGQQAMPPFQVYNHGQEAISNIQNTRSSVPNNNQDYLQNFKNEIIQAVREEVNKGMTRDL